VGRHTPDEVEQAFFGAIISDAPVEKVAELDPDTASALGVESVSPTVLKQLEAQAADGASEPETAPEAAGPEEATEVPTADAEPELAPGEEPTPEPELPSRLTHGVLFSDKRSHPLEIFDTLNLRYKEQWASWEPPTLWWALRRDFGPVGKLARDKIGALRVAALTDTLWLDWDVFENAGLAWNGVAPIFGAYQPMTPSQAAFTVQILRGVRESEAFENEINAYIAAILEEYGFVYAPEEYFAGAQALLDRKDWTVGLRSDVEATWLQVREHDPVEIEWRKDNPVDVHIVKLFAVQDYLNRQEALRGAPLGIDVGSTTTSAAVPS